MRLRAAASHRKSATAIVCGSIVVELDLQSVDALLHELENAKEDGIDAAGSNHADSQSAVHALVVELDRNTLRGDVSGSGQNVTLVHALRAVDGIDESPRDKTAHAARTDNSQRISRGVSARIGHELLGRFVCHEVECSADSVTD